MANKIGINFDFWKIIRLVAWTGLIIFIIYMLSGCAVRNASTVVDKQANYERWLNPLTSIPEDVEAVILPHHLLVESYMDKFYAQLAEENKYARVVIIAPNHFGYGYNFVQTTDIINVEEKTIDSESRLMLQDAPELDQAWIAILEKAKVAMIEPKYYSREHGVFTHYQFLKKYFPDAQIVPIIIKRHTPEKVLDNLAEELEALINGDEGRTLILTSLDFSHYTSEDLAVKNDLRMMKWLSVIDGTSDLSKISLESAEKVGASFDQENIDSVAVDSPEALYVVARLMADANAHWEMWARTSSASLINGLPPSENTSHIFGYFAGN